MRLLKKTLKVTGIILLLLVTFAFAAPFLFKGKIITLVKEEINKSLDAKTDFKDVNISFFRQFPKVSVGITGLQVIGVGEFSSDTLIAAKEIQASLNLMSVIKGSDYKVYSVIIDEPRIHAIINKDGRANWEITKVDSLNVETPEVSSPFTMNLQHYEIKNAWIRYDDAAGNMSTEIRGLNHEGSGDFTSDLFTLKTSTRAEGVDFNYGSIPYLSGTKTTLDADIEIDNTNNTYRFKTDKIHLNELQLASEGTFQLVNDSTYKMDINFAAPSTDFRHILSMVPSVYRNDFAEIKTSGKAIFNGFVKGTYDNRNMPAYNINLDVSDGFFQYPDLPKPVKNINLRLKVNNPDGVTDHVVVDIPKAHLELGNDPFDFRLLVKNPVSDMFIDAGAKGRLDLATIKDFVKLESGTQLRGMLNADITVNGNLSAMEQQQYERFHSAGSIRLEEFLYSSKEYPDGIALHTLLMSFNPKNVTLSDLTGQYMKSNFSANGTINNLLPYLFKGQALNGSLNVKADKVNLNDWMGTSADTTTTETTTAPFIVPANIDFTINANVDQVKYDMVDFENVTGALTIENETVKINNVKADALDGTMGISGTYSTLQSKKNPDISLIYDVKGLDVQKTFIAFNTFQKLMPIAKYLGGKLSSQLSFTGKLGEDMMPDLNSLTGQGNLLLIEGFLKKFAPLEKLAQTINVKELEAISLRDVKNYIEFTNGKVLVKPFSIRVKEIDMEIGGMHGFDQTMDYTLNLKVPRALMGEKGNQFVNNLVTQVNNKGIPVKVGDIVNLKVKMGGTMMDPILKTDLKQTANSLADDLKQQVTDFAKQKIDSTRTAVKTAVKDTIASAKKQVIAAAQDEIKKQLLGGKKDSTGSASSDPKKALTESGKGLIDNINPFKKKKKDVDTSTRKN